MEPIIYPDLLIKPGRLYHPHQVIPWQAVIRGVLGLLVVVQVLWRGILGAVC
jgi:hypothetical protein